MGGGEGRRVGGDAPGASRTRSCPRAAGCVALRIGILGSGRTRRSFTRPDDRPGSGCALTSGPPIAAHMGGPNRVCDTNHIIPPSRLWAAESWCVLALERRLRPCRATFAIAGFVVRCFGGPVEGVPSARASALADMTRHWIPANLCRYTKLPSSSAPRSRVALDTSGGCEVGWFGDAHRFCEVQQPRCCCIGSRDVAGLGSRWY